MTEATLEQLEEKFTRYEIARILGARALQIAMDAPLLLKIPDKELEDVNYNPLEIAKKELLAANKTNDEICEYIGAKSLKFLSLSGLYKAIGFDKRNDTYPQLTDHYFTGDYPVKPIDELGDNKVTQLSLLSTASNN